MLPRKIKQLCKKFVRHVYSERVTSRFNSSKNVGSLDKKQKNVGSGLVGAPACGDVMKLDIQVNKDNIIEEAKFKTFGCGSAIASSDYAVEHIKGKHIEFAQKVTNIEIAKHLNLPPVKLHCSMLAQDAIKAAIEDFQSKNK